MSIQLNKALKLAKKTGDRLIVFESPESENAYVVMDLGQYEDLVDCALSECGDECECDCGHDHDYEHEEEIDQNVDDDLGDDLSAEALAEEGFEPEHFDYANEVRNLTEEELLDKINRDIALWKESQKEILDEESTSEGPENTQHDDSESEIRNKSKWAIRNDVKENADEIIEEDRHYLEEVKY